VVIFAAMKRLLTVSTALLVLFTSCKKNKLLTEKEVAAVINSFDEGWRTKNLQEVDSVLAPVYIYFTQSGGVFSREGVVKTAGSDEYKLDTVSRSVITVQLFENTAVASTRWKGKGIYRGVPFDEDQRCSIIIVKANDKIQILSEHCTPIKTSGAFH
jgi:hypothetical protein